MRFKHQFMKSFCIIFALAFICIFCAFSFDEENLSRVRTILNKYYYTNLPDSIISLPTIEDIIKEINKTDARTKYYTKDEFQEIINSTTQAGIGLSVSQDKKGLKIVNVIEKSPSSLVGVKPGDIIIEASGHNMEGLKMDDSLKYIMGEEGSFLKIIVLRGEKKIELNVVRKRINTDIASHILNGHIKYITILQFGYNVADDFQTQISEGLANKKIDSIIIDLRNNGGGYLQAGADVASFFIGNKTASIVYNRIDGNRSLKGRYNSLNLNKKIVLLVNKYSAGSSEILTSALKEYKKAFIIGSNTCGSSYVQELFQLPNGDELKLTSDCYLTPMGKPLDNVGVTPDLKVNENCDSQKVAELMLNSPRKLTSNNGYVKFSIINYGDVIINLAQVKNKDYYRALSQIVENIYYQKGILVGRGRSWKLIKGMDKNKFKNFILSNRC